MPSYQGHKGYTNAKDPSRLLWYGPNCTYWTDDWDKMSAQSMPGAPILTYPGGVKKPAPGIPCCPVCGSVGFQMEIRDWDAGIARFMRENPGYDYAKAIADVKEICTEPGRNFGEWWQMVKDKYKI